MGVTITALCGVSISALSTAIEAGVPEMLRMQCGHAQSQAARSYVALQSPSRQLLHAWIRSYLVNHPVIRAVLKARSRAFGSTQLPVYVAGYIMNDV